jgi:polysaccharide export outer membrane protein
MRRCRFLLLSLAGLALAVGARLPEAHAQQAPPAVAHSELDTLMYGAPPPPNAQLRYAAPVYRRATPTYQPQTVPAYQHVAPKPYGTPGYAPPAAAYGPCQPYTHVRCAPTPGYVAVAAEPANYTLDTGDKLRIVVFGQDTLSNTYAVDAAGMVTLPLIGGVSARGLTTQQLSGAIAGRLKASFLRDPSVAVEVDTYRPFFVLGEVTYPGQYPYVPSMTAEKAVAIAGGFTPRAAKDVVTVTRKFQGLPGRLKLPLQSLVLPGDAITVGERWF